MNQKLRIGDVATRSGVTRDTIRFYERSGLLDTPARTSSRHRVYGPDTLERVRFVRQLQNCGLTISDIRELLFLRDSDGPVASKRLLEILRRRLVSLEERIASYESCRTRLIDIMRKVAAARARGYSALAKLPDGVTPPPYRFGRAKA